MTALEGHDAAFVRRRALGGDIEIACVKHGGELSKWEEELDIETGSGRSGDNDGHAEGEGGDGGCEVHLDGGRCCS